MFSLFTINADLDRRLRIIESSYGRDLGWIMEHRGQPIALLHDPRWSEDMYWVWYRVEPATADPFQLDLLQSPDFWRSCDYVFRSRGFPDEVVTTAFGHRYRPKDDEVNMRGLYISSMREPTLWESIWCWRRLARARRRMRSGTHWRTSA